MIYLVALRTHYICSWSLSLPPSLSLSPPQFSYLPSLLILIFTFYIKHGENIITSNVYTMLKWYKNVQETDIQHKNKQINILACLMLAKYCQMVGGWSHSPRVAASTMNLHSFAHFFSILQQNLWKSENMFLILFSSLSIWRYTTHY